eukprot:550873-Amphidinium_carterae.1
MTNLHANCKQSIRICFGYSLCRVCYCDLRRSAHLANCGADRSLMPKRSYQLLGSMGTCVIMLSCHRWHMQV